jgi:hypothetical protein
MSISLKLDRGEGKLGGFHAFLLLDAVGGLTASPVG